MTKNMIMFLMFGINLAWKQLKMNLNLMKMKLELVTDLDMHISFEKGKRGGISYISNIYIAKPTINIWNLMAQNNNKNILYA